MSVCLFLIHLEPADCYIYIYIMVSKRSLPWKHKILQYLQYRVAKKSPNPWCLTKERKRKFTFAPSYIKKNTVEICGEFHTFKEVKVKWSRYRPGVAQRVGRGIALLFHDRGTRRVWVVSSTLRPHFTPRERPGTHFTGGWVGPQGRSGRAENLVPTGIRSQTSSP